MSKVELEFECKKCGKRYPSTINFSGKIEDVDLDDNQSRCPFCGEWNCAEPEALSRALKDL